MNKVICFTFAAVLATVLGACSSRPAIVEAPAEPTPVVTIYEYDRYLISGQPSEADLARVAERGVTTVVNLRSVEETETLSYDQQAAVEALGMTYVHIPMGRDHGYNPEQIEAVAQLLESSDKPVYMHCASGGRARLLWTGYMVDRQSMPLAEATRIAEESLGQSEPAIARLLGRPVTSAVEPSPTSPDADSQ